jgi:hypothetical protein
MRRALVWAGFVCGLAMNVLVLGSTQAFAAFSPVLHVTPAPDIYAGDAVRVSITAPSWPAGVTAQVWFQSSSEDWQANAPWGPTCVCFAVERTLAPLEHPDENVVIKAELTWGVRGHHHWWLTNKDRFVPLA